LGARSGKGKAQKLVNLMFTLPSEAGEEIASISIPPSASEGRGGGNAPSLPGG